MKSLKCSPRCCLLKVSHLFMLAFYHFGLIAIIITAKWLNLAVCRKRVIFKHQGETVTHFLIWAAVSFDIAGLLSWWWDQFFCVCLWDGCGSRLQCRLWWRGVCPCWWGRVAAVSRECWLVLRPTSERKGGIPAYSLLHSGIHARKMHKLYTTWPTVLL